MMPRWSSMVSLSVVLFLFHPAQVAAAATSLPLLWVWLDNMAELSLNALGPADHQPAQPLHVPTQPPLQYHIVIPIVKNMKRLKPCLHHPAFPFPQDRLWRSSSAYIPTPQESLLGGILPPSLTLLPAKMTLPRGTTSSVSVLIVLDSEKEEDTILFWLHLSIDNWGKRLTHHPAQGPAPGEALSSHQSICTDFCLLVCQQSLRRVTSGEL